MKTILLAALMLLPIATMQAAQAAPDNTAAIIQSASAQCSPAAVDLFTIDGIVAECTADMFVIIPIDNHETAAMAALDDVWKVTADNPVTAAAWMTPATSDHKVPPTTPGDTVNNGFSVYAVKMDVDVLAVGTSIIGNEGAGSHADTADPALASAMT